MILSCKWNFLLILFLECGYHLDEGRMKLLNAYLDGRQVTEFGQNSFLNVMNYNKELELMNETEYEANEYLDAFVALGGSPDKDGSVSKETLI